MSDDVWRKYINGLEGMDFPDGGGSPSQEEMIEVKPQPKKVFVQKIITEIYVYTDTENKLFGEQTIQDIQILGEMDYEQALRMIGQKKMRRKRKNDDT